MKANEITLSPYKVTWVEFFPKFGIVTKHDRKLFGEVIRRGVCRTYIKHFANRDAALKWLYSFDASKLDKPYTCYLFTDKQFSMAKESDGYRIPYTQKQLDNPVHLG